MRPFVLNPGYEIDQDRADSRNSTKEVEQCNLLFTIGTRWYIHVFLRRVTFNHSS